MRRDCESVDLGEAWTIGPAGSALTVGWPDGGRLGLEVIADLHVSVRPPSHRAPRRCLPIRQLGLATGGLVRTCLAAAVLATLAGIPARAERETPATGGECPALDARAAERRDGYPLLGARLAEAARLYRWLGSVELLGLTWAVDAPPEGMVALQPGTAAALSTLPSTAGLPSGFPPGGGYRGEFYETYRPPPHLDEPAFSATYDEAAQAYRDQDWAEAIRRMDRVAADAASPYRAAAAYTAARAALTMDGGAADGLQRLRAMLADTALAEFHRAGEGLLGTLATRLQTPFLVRAALAELFQRAAARADVVCGDEAWAARFVGALEELDGRADYAFADQRWNRRGSLYDGTPETWRAWDELARLDPMAALARALVAPASHRGAAGWLPGGVLFHRAELLDPLVAPLRAMAEATRQPVWIAAYADRTEALEDLPLIEAGWHAVKGRPLHGAAGHAASLVGAELLIHRARLLVAAGRTGAALEALREGGPWLVEASHRPAAAEALAWLAHAALSGGARRLAAGGDHQGVQAWLRDAPAVPWVAAALERAQPEFGFFSSYSVSVGREPREVYYLAVPTPEGLVGPWRMSLLTRAVLDLQPASELIRLAGLPSVPSEERRAMFAAGFVRLHLLGRDAEALRHAAAMRALFPELEAEIGDLAAGSGDPEQAMARFLLRVPGFTPRLLYARERYFYPQDGRGLLRAIDDRNPNDRNWWCRLDPAWMRTEAYILFLQRLGNDTALISTLQESHFAFADFGFPLAAPLGFDPRRAAIASGLVARSEPFAGHPLLTGADWAELERLSREEPGPTRLARIAARWAESTGWLARLLGRDEGLAETLHLAVRATRYGCRREEGAGAVSRDAFRHLHRLYPGSDWARRTPYWFDRHTP